MPGCGLGRPQPPTRHAPAQEGGRRAGTESILLAAGLGAAAALAAAELPAAGTHMAACRDRLQRRLLAAFPEVNKTIG